MNASTSEGDSMRRARRVKAGRWFRIGLRDPIEFVDRLRIARQGRSESPEAWGTPSVRGGLSRPAPTSFEDLAEILGLEQRAAHALDHSDDQPWSRQLDADWSAFWDGIDYRAGHDADPALVRTVWLSCRILRPTIVLETGVGRGLSTTAILDALERNGTGHLISIDLPPLADPWFSASCELVPDNLRHRWAYRRGSVHRELPKTLRAIQARGEQVGLHLADSLHTAEHIQWEVEMVRPFLAEDGLHIVDDVTTWVVRHPEVAGRTVLTDETKADAFAIVHPPR